MSNFKVSKVGKTTRDTNSADATATHAVRYFVQGYYCFGHYFHSNDKKIMRQRAALPYISTKLKKLVVQPIFRVQLLGKEKGKELCWSTIGDNVN